MDPFSAAQLEEYTFVKSAHVLSELASTNTYARELASRDKLDLPALVVAVKQTAGRGQQNRTWWSGPGSLTFTLAIENLDRDAPGLVAIAAAIAVCKTISAFAPNIEPQVKWPNDVLVDGKKISGVLIESIALSRSITLVGIGVNTNCSLADAEVELQAIASSLKDLTGSDVDQQQFLIQLVNELNTWIYERQTKGVIGSFMNVSKFNAGDPICVKSSRFGILTGQFVGINAVAELIVSVDGKSLAIASGSIVDPD